MKRWRLSLTPHPTLNQLEKFQFEVSAVVKTGDNVGFHDVIYEGRGGKKKIFARASSLRRSEPLIIWINALPTSFSKRLVFRN